MIDAYLASLQERLQRRDRRGTWVGAVVALASCGLLVEAWTERIPLSDQIAASLFMSFIAYVAVASIRRNAGRSAALTSLLRERPMELRSVRLAWISGRAIPYARLTFELQDGTRFADEPLAEDVARAAAETIHAAFPWTCPRGT